MRLIKPGGARARIILPTMLLFSICFAVYFFLGSSPAFTTGFDLRNKHAVAAKAKPQPKSLFTPEEQAVIKRRPRYAICSSVQTASYTALALMLGYSIRKHNDLAAMDAEMVMLIREGGEDGVSALNRTRLEQVGWKIRVAEELSFEGVDTTKIRSHHRHNLNKLHLWSWTEYEKILFIDADTVVKGPLAELFEMPGDFAAAPDVWWNVLTDNKFNSGVIVFRPSVREYQSLIKHVSDPNYHKENDADQAFLNVYYRFRYFGLPYKYNFNLIMYQFHRPYWDMLWDEAVIVHFTVRKPKSNPNEHCHKGCNEWEPMEWFAALFKEMLSYYGWENDIPLFA